MKRKWIVAGMALAMLALAVVPAVVAQDGNETGAQAFARGQALLKKGELRDALQAFGVAARAPDAQAEYKQKFMLVRNVIKMRQALAVQDDPAKWNKIAVRLRNFYYTLRLYEDLYKLAHKMHERNPSASSAVLMADALLCLNRNAEAEKALRSVDASKLNLHARTLLALALARQKKTDEAKGIVAAIQMPEQVSPRFLLDVARVKVLVGDVDGGLADLTVAFERTNPKGLAGFKTFTQGTPDFKSVPAERFAKVLATKSKVEASSCSGGSSCGSCPKRGTCGGASGGSGGSCSPPEKK